MLNNSLIASDRTPFRFGVNENGEYGYIITDSEGADSVLPFKNGEELSISVSTSATLYGVGGDYKHQAVFTTNLVAKKSDGTILLSKSITGDTGRVRDIYNGECSNSGTYNITV